MYRSEHIIEEEMQGKRGKMIMNMFIEMASQKQIGNKQLFKLRCLNQLLENLLSYRKNT